MADKKCKIKGSAASFVLLYCFTQTGCLATLAHDPARGFLCEVVESNGWKDSQKMIDGINYSFRVADLISKERGDWPDTKAIHWVQIIASTPGKAVGAPVPPVIYDSAEAELDVFGKKVKAPSEMWQFGKEAGGVGADMKFRSPVNLNVLNDAPSEYFYIAFPIEIKDPKTEYIFRPGTILLNGVRYPLPVYKSCYTPSKWWWSPIH